MDEILTKIENDFKTRFNRVSSSLEEKKDWSILNRVLNLNDSDCYRLFNQTNTTIEDIENLYSILVNCLLDDSSLMVNVEGQGIFTKLYLSWGSDAYPAVSEQNLHSLVDILEEQREFYLANKEAIDNYSILRTEYKKYFKYQIKLTEKLFELASKEIQKEYKTRALKTNV